MPSWCRKKKVRSETETDQIDHFISEKTEALPVVKDSSVAVAKDVSGNYKKPEAVKEKAADDIVEQKKEEKINTDIAPEIEPKPPIKKVSGKKGIGHLSLKNMMAKSNENSLGSEDVEFVADSDEDVKNALKAISLELLEKAWEELKTHFTAKNEINFSNIICAAKPKIKEGLLYVLVVNSVQQKTFEQNLEEVLIVLKKALGLNKLKLYFEEKKLDDGTAVPYTDKEKFALMAKKNPDLIILQQTFGLEPDF